MAAIPRPVWIVDTTLRDGEQAPGIAFDPATRLAIARRLDHAGVDELEVGVPAMGRAARREIRAVAALNLGCRLSSWCRALEKDIELALRCGTDGVHISFPVSPILMRAMNKTRRGVMRQVEALVSFSLSHFAFVSVGAQDAFRAGPGFLKSFVARAAQAGAHRVRIADTVGLARPLQAAEMVWTLRQVAGDMELEFHGHNDLGMATANTVAAIEADIQAVSVTVNGLGERAGNAPLEQVAVAVKTLDGRNCGIDVSRLMGLCRLVARATRRDIPVDRPITGDGVFRHESGIHAAAVIKDSRTYQPFCPGMLGRQGGELVLGRHSGSNMVKHLLSQAGITIKGAGVERLLAAIRAEAAVKQRGLHTEDLMRLYQTSQ